MERNLNQNRCGMNQRANMQGRSYQGRMSAPGMPTPVNTVPGCSSQAAANTIEQFPIAMAYVPWQTFENTYNLCEGLMNGTIFPELNLPFEGGRCQRR